MPTIEQEMEMAWERQEQSQQEEMQELPLTGELS